MFSTANVRRLLSIAMATTFESACQCGSTKRAWAPKIEVPTTDGRALLRIPQGTKNGQKFRLREKFVLNSGAENGETRSCRWPYKLR